MFRELDQLHEKLDRLEEKIDNILDKLGNQQEKVTKLESFAGFVKVGISLAIPILIKIIYDWTRMM